MIYEFTGATIKHNFPRAVLMTWWERYFIKAIAPGMDTETQAVGTKRTKYCPLTSGDSSLQRIADNKDTKRSYDMRPRAQDMRRLRLYRTCLIFFWSYQINTRMNLEPWGQTSETAVAEEHNSSLTNEEEAFRLSFFTLSELLHAWKPILARR